MPQEMGGIKKKKNMELRHKEKKKERTVWI